MMFVYFFKKNYHANGIDIKINWTYYACIN